ncbi:MAG: gliding motility-associated C-terminal domain-containing protein [Chitinophagales bacterium]|nr:gliding motility-associated C-terminal domain-containing protein [Sphingobacteriales bacterium]MBP9141967.1 gliding motility-associated C-terminal domain-containing protein [Chitinophagales bacterium]MDA0198853.1 gliding motility-associated C-terminal domain-containing protein [Bacteroidota bacterium]MBK6890217.1 gliding motility-associated C-terminal domain-containing protein [Sphingobacteriales bacterium]MBL0248471.1 gliding motility-associated C-terminal domain-containing protein [Sphingo
MIHPLERLNALWAFSFFALLLTGALGLQAQTCSFTINGSGPPFYLCASDLPATLEGSPSGGSFSGSAVIGNIFNPVAIPGEFMITYLAPGAACVVTETIQVDVPSKKAMPNPIADFYCKNDNTSYPLSGNLGADGYFTLDNIKASNITPSLLSPGPHTLQYAYIDPNNGCVDVYTNIINVMTPPDMTVKGLLPVFCLDNPVTSLSCVGTLAGPGITGGYAFDPAKAGLGKHIITHTFADLANICKATETFTVEVVAPLNLDFALTTDNCFAETDTIAYTGQALDATAAYNWSVEGGQIIQNLNNMVVVKWQGMGNKQVTLTLNNVVCEGASLSKNISKSELAVGLPENILLKGGQTYTFEPAINNPDGLNLSYLWSPSLGLSCSTCPQPIAAPGITTNYQLTITDANNCTITRNTTITIVDGQPIFVPNIFTPNDDGLNDILYVRGSSIEALTFAIFDRMGEKVFETSDQTTGWDGTWRNKKLNGVYVWVAQVTLLGGKPEIYKGTITVVR